MECDELVVDSANVHVHEKQDNTLKWRGSQIRYVIYPPLRACACVRTIGREVAKEKAVK